MKLWFTFCLSETRENPQKHLQQLKRNKSHVYSVGSIRTINHKLLNKPPTLHHYIYYNIHLYIYIKVVEDDGVIIAPWLIFIQLMTFNRNCLFLSDIEIAIVRILNLRRRTCRMLQIIIIMFFLNIFACLGDEEKR